jgi:hypothetical protein
MYPSGYMNTSNDTLRYSINIPMTIISPSSQEHDMSNTV